MAGYAIYIPGAKGSNPQHLVDVGLDSLAVDGLDTFADVLDGSPDGKTGILAVKQSLDPAINPPLVASAYTWTPAKCCTRRQLPECRFWFGVPKGKAVTPKAIERKNLSLGYGVALRDRQEWHIPEAMNLPHVHGLDSQGEFERKIAEEHREFWDMSQQYAVEFFRAIDQLDLLKKKRPQSQTDVTVCFTLADGWDFCCKALSINYRLTPELIDMLALLDDTGMRNVIKAVIGLPVLFEDRVQKKTDDLTIPVG